MSQPLPTHLGPHGEKPVEPAVVEPGFEVAVQEFWARNRNFVLLLCAAALLVIAGREGWQYFAHAREKDLQAEYAKTGDSADRLAKFADEHSGHALAGVAYLRVADEKYSVADYKSAATTYQKAAGSLQNDALLGRAKLGAAVSLLQGGDLAGGEAALKALSADPAVFASARAEATYHLASLAAAAGQADEVKKLTAQVSVIEATGPWAQRASLLVASLPADAAAKPVVGTTTDTPSLGISFKPATPEKPPGK
ncbi:MAG: tetratricopeptide repeat protein [Lacunisphaera sp.]|nr:tetratricopeptide repeat protein [Lacunisphaera sp.]